MIRRARWQHFIDAAVDGKSGSGTPATFAPALPAAPQQRRPGQERWNRVVGNHLAQRLLPSGKNAGRAVDSEGRVRRADLRLVPAALSVWGSAAAGGYLPPPFLVALCCVLLTAAAALIIRGMPTRHAARSSRRRTGSRYVRHRSLAFTVAIALMLGAAAAAHSAISASARTMTPFAVLVAQEAGVAAIVKVTGAPRSVGRNPFGTAEGEERWAVSATLSELSADGSTFRTATGTVSLTVIGGQDLGRTVPGQLVRVTGKLSAARPGEGEAGMLSAATAVPAAQPGAEPAVSGAAAGLTGTSVVEGLQGIRQGYVASARFLPPDARGLLPAMVTGDTSGLDPELEEVMRTVGMSHLTAVSGANCSLVIGALLLLARTLRLARPPAALFALGGLALFVGLVGPEPSVLRAAFTGFIAVASLAGGRPGRGLSLLCLAVLALLLVAPTLATDIGFLLSVAATLGIVLLAGRMMVWASAWVPQWLAALVAVPLSAQVFCGPIVVLLQPAYSSYALLANILSAPLVAPVTILGTAAVPFVMAAPWLTATLNVPAGLCSQAIAWIARSAAGQSGSSLPWPEGPVGVGSMCLLSVLSVLAVWALLNPRPLVRQVLALHARTEALLAALEGRREKRGAGKDARGRKHRQGPPPHRKPRRLPCHRPVAAHDGGEVRGSTQKVTWRGFARTFRTVGSWPARRQLAP